MTTKERATAPVISDVWPADICAEAALQTFQRDVQRQREVVREARRRDAMPYSEAEELTLP